MKKTIILPLAVAAIALSFTACSNTGTTSVSGDHAASKASPSRAVGGGGAGGDDGYAANRGPR